MMVLDILDHLLEDGLQVVVEVVDMMHLAVVAVVELTPLLMLVLVRVLLTIQLFMDLMLKPVLEVEVVEHHLMVVEQVEILVMLVVPVL
jgi:hypothetical protein